MFNLLPKDEKFYDELEQLADRVIASSSQFEEVVTSSQTLTANSAG